MRRLALIALASCSFVRDSTAVLGERSPDGAELVRRAHRTADLEARRSLLVQAAALRPRDRALHDELGRLEDELGYPGAAVRDLDDGPERDHLRGARAAALASIPRFAADLSVEGRVAAWLRGETERELDLRDLPRGDTPAWLLPTRLRLSGDADGAKAALPAAEAAARTDGQRAVVALEEAAADDLAAARKLAPAGDALLAMTLARLGGSPVDAKGVPVEILAARGEVPAPAPGEIAPGWWRCGPTPSPAELAAMTARPWDFIDRAPAIACRGPAVARALAAAGDFAGAVAIEDALLVETPGDAEAARDAAIWLVEAGNGPRAWLYLPRAELGATVRGAASVAFARAFLRAGDAIEAIHAGRQALAVANSGETRDAAFAVLIDACTAAGRTDDAIAARMAWDKDRGVATAKVHDLGAAGGVPDRAASPDELRAQLELLAAAGDGARAWAAAGELTSR